MDTIAGAYLGCLGQQIFSASVGKSEKCRYEVSSMFASVHVCLYCDVYSSVSPVAISGHCST